MHAQFTCAASGHLAAVPPKSMQPSEARMSSLSEEIAF
jgi:hypothetical protein